MRIKAIDISEVTKEQQVNKFIEEVAEFLAAIVKNDVENIKEEYCDILTSGIGVLKKYGISEDEVENYFENKHMEKLKKRNFKPRNK